MMCKIQIFTKSQSVFRKFPASFVVRNEFPLFIQRFLGVDGFSIPRLQQIFNDFELFLLCLIILKIC